MHQHLLYAYLLVRLVCVHSTGAAGLSTDCVRDKSKIICQNNLPDQLETNVSSVVVTDYLKGSINNETFKHFSWSSVTLLDITVNSKLSSRLTLGDYDMVQLKALVFLGIHAPLMRYVGRYAFQGLIRLQTLDLSHCTHIQRSLYIQAILETNIVLKSLRLNFISAQRLLEVNQQFMHMVSEKQIQELSLSGSNFALRGPINISGMEFKLRYVDVSNTTFITMNFTTSDKIQFLSDLKVLNISYIKSRFLELKYDFLYNYNYIDNQNCPLRFIGAMLVGVETIVSDGMSQNTFIGNNSFVDLSTCIINVKYLYLKYNHVQYLNVTIKWPNEQFILEVDLSENQMQYINPNLLSGCTKLEVLNLAWNSLNFMERHEEFGSLLNTFIELRHFNMSSNQLSFIPIDMFINNAKLETLDFSNNVLRSITFNLPDHLQELYLRDNQINILADTDIGKLNALLNVNESESHDVDIDLTGNPIICSCESKHFLKWIYNTMQAVTKRLYKCQLDGQMVSIDQNAIDKSEFLCVRTAIIIITSCVSVAILVAISLVVAYKISATRRRQRLKTKNKFLVDLLNGNLKQKYLCFVSYSSYVSTDLVKEIGNGFIETLSQVTGIHDIIVCMGDEKFYLGCSIVNEIFRCVEESCVAVYLVCRQFCRSKWCLLELRIAYEQNMPIILIFLEEVEERMMPPLLLNIFNTTTRAKLILHEGKHELVPNYEVLCKSVIELAAYNYRNKHV